MQEKEKIILLDGGVFCHRAIFQWQMMQQMKNKNNSSALVMPSHYNYFASMLSSMKKIGINKDDIVILALEGHSWRKDYLAEYKGNRASYREEQELIDWDYHYQKINEVNEAIEKGTNWHVLRFPEFAEADDIMAVACKTFKDKECVVVTIDKDLFQLAYFPNVKIFSLNKKCKGSRGMFEKVEDPLQILAKKCEKGDISDNILVRSDDTEQDFELREFIINLLELPDFVEEPIKEVLLNLPKKEINYSELPFQKSLGKKFDQVYNKDKVITYDYCVALQEKRDIQKKKKAKEKRDEKKKEKK